MTTGNPDVPPSRANSPATSLSGACRQIVASAPNPCSVLNTSRLRPAATTRPAPSSFAILTASLPVTPVAPRISTFSPAVTFARYASASHADTPGFGSAAAVTSSNPSGTGKQNARGATARSAIAPKGARTPPKNTRCPSLSVPTPSVPHTNGSSREAAKCPPLASCLSIGFIDAARTCTSASPSPATGSANSSHRGASPIARTTAARIVAPLIDFSSPVSLPASNYTFQHDSIVPSAPGFLSYFLSESRPHEISPEICHIARTRRCTHFNTDSRARNSRHFRHHQRPGIRRQRRTLAQA